MQVNIINFFIRWNKDFFCVWFKNKNSLWT